VIYVGGLVERFIEHLKGRGFLENTVGSYFGVVRSFARWCEGTYGSFDPAAVTPLDVADYRRYLLDRGKKPGTVNHALDVLGSFFSWAKEEGIVQSDPTDGVKRVPEEKKAPRWLDRKDMGALLRAVQKYGTPRDKALVFLLLHTGLRVSEACSLKVADVVIRERSGNVVVRRGKGEKWREVPLNVTLRKVLAEYLDVHPGEEWLFVSRKGNKLSVRAAERVIEKYAGLAGLEGVTPHVLRHTFCKMLVDAGESLDRVAVLAGHSNLNTTARYTRPGVQDLEKAVEKLSWE
jgi:integrase/recombinase XerC